MDQAMGGVLTPCVSFPLGTPRKPPLSRDSVTSWDPSTITSDWFGPLLMK